MEQINVSQLAEKLNTKVELLITKLKLIGIEVNASSRLDEITILKITLLLIDNPRVEDIAKTFHLSTRKVIEKFSSLGVNVFSKISIVNQKDLIKFLKLQDLSLLKINEETQSKEAKSQAEKKKRKVTKRVRFHEVASQLPVSKKKILAQLNEMHVFITDDNTLLDETTVNELKKRISDSSSFGSIVSEGIKNTSTKIIENILSIFTSTGFAATILILCICCLSALSVFNYFKAVNYPKWKIIGLQMPFSDLASDSVQNVGLLEIHKSDIEIPVALEDSYVSELTPTLIFSKKSSIPGSEGITVLSDPVGDTYNSFISLVPGDILILKTTDKKDLYFKITPSDIFNKLSTFPLKSALMIQVKQENKTLEIQAILQKH